MSAVVVSPANDSAARQLLGHLTHIISTRTLRNPRIRPESSTGPRLAHPLHVSCSLFNHCFARLLQREEISSRRWSIVSRDGIRRYEAGR